MSNEHGNGSGGGNGGGNDDFYAREEPTVVLVSRDFLIGSLGRTATALFGAGGVCLDSRSLVTSGAGSAALRELIEELSDLGQIIAGMCRALERIEFDEENKP